MRASKKITTIIVAIYMFAFIALAALMFNQAQRDIHRESRSAFALAESLVSQQLPALSLETILKHNRHLRTWWVPANESNPDFQPSLNSSWLYPAEDKAWHILYKDPDGRAQDLLIFGNQRAEVDEITSTVFQVFGVFAGSLLITLLTLRIAVSAKLRPLKTLCSGLRSVEQGHYDVAVEQSDINEINQLVDHYRQMAESLNRKQGQVLRLRSRLAKLQEQERRNLARELHDNLGQLVTGLTVQGFMLKQQSSNTPYVEQTCDLIQHQCDEMQRSLKHLTNQLYPMPLNRVGLIPSLRLLCERWQSIHQITANFRSLGEDLSIDVDRDTHIYRIAQEALNNVARHAQATLVHVMFDVNQEEITLIIADNGIGISVSADSQMSEGLGLESMRDRAALLQGQLDVDNNNDGVRLRLKIPLMTKNETISHEYSACG